MIAVAIVDDHPVVRRRSFEIDWLLDRALLFALL
jgi:hypothetical protein